jgi:uncharacterized iron-regulated membrane protein
MAVASVDLREVNSIPRLQLAQTDGHRATRRFFRADTGAPLDAESAEGDRTPEPSEVTQRNRLKAWHKGSAAGLVGQALGLLTGVSLLALVVTGLQLYLRLWAARRARGLPAFFWRNGAAESPWRRLHRSVAMVASVWLLNTALTGSVLALAELQLNVFLQYGLGAPPYPRPTPMPPVSQARLSPDLASQLQTAWRAAQEQEPGAEILAVQLVVRDGIPKALVSLDRTAPHVRVFQALTGEPLKDPANDGVQMGQGYYADWHQVLKRMHRGDILGYFSGRWVSLVSGLSLLYLLTSATVMFGRAWRQRAAAGKHHLWW